MCPLALPLLAACKAECDPPSTLSGLTWTVFGNLVTWESTGPVNPPDPFPVNGTTTWTFAWGGQAEGPVTVTIDGQVFDGAGDWGTEREACGTFGLVLDGIWTSSGGVRHVFETSGDLLFYDDVLEGSLTWSDRWQFGEASGVIEASEAAIHGELTAL